MNYFLKFYKFKEIGTVLFFLFFNLTAYQAFSQEGPPVEWKKKFISSGFEYHHHIGKVIINAHDHGYLMGGYLYNLESEAPLPHVYDFWIIRTDSSGNKMWDKFYGGTESESLSSIVADKNGGYLLAGTSYSFPRGDYWIVKIASDGTKIWDKSFGGLGDDVLSSAIQTEDGGFLLGGYSNSAKSSDKSEDPRPGADNNGKVLYDYWIVKINSNGDKEWDKTFGGDGSSTKGVGQDKLEKIIQANDGGFILAGSSNSIQGYEKTAERICSSCDNTNSDYWLVKVDKNGNKLWDKTYGGYADDRLADIEKLPNGEFFIGGNSTSGISGNKMVAPGTPWKNQNHVWLLKINDSGNKVWEKTHIYGEDEIGTIEGEDPFPLIETTLFSIMNYDDGYVFAANVRRSYLNDYDFLSLKKFDWEGNFMWRKEEITHKQYSYYADILKPQKIEDGIIVATSISDDESSPSSYYVFKISLLTLPLNYSLSNAYWSNRVFVSRLTHTQGHPDVEKIEVYAGNVKVGEDTTGPDYSAPVKLPIGNHPVHVKAYEDGKVKDLSTRWVTSRYTDAVLYKAINVNGPTIDKNYVFFDGDIDIAYESSIGNSSFTATGVKYENQRIPLIPATDASLTQVLRSCVSSNKTTPGKYTFTSVPNGVYEVYAYVWEDNFPESFRLKVNGKSVGTLTSEYKGWWKKIGPLKTNVTNGKIEVVAEGGAANVSAFEIWRPCVKDQYGTVQNYYEKVYRSINLNGPQSNIDNLTYEGSSNAANFSYQGRLYANQSLPLNFPTDPDRSKMLRSVVYSTRNVPAVFTFTNVPSGMYHVYLNVWEDNFPTKYSIAINNTTLPGTFTNGNKGDWDVIGPFEAYSVNGKLTIKAFGGDANISGIELWKVNTGDQEDNTQRLVGKDIEIEKTELFPNPARSEVTIQIPSTEDEKVNIILLDLLGRVYMKENVTVKGGKINLKLPSSEMLPGNYLLKLQYKNKLEVLQLNKL